MAMKPGDHPDFFRLPPPPGTSRESNIVLDREGRFFHEGDRVSHPSLSHALHTWIARHPDDGRYILTNGYDWCYFRVEDTPFVVRGVHFSEECDAPVTSELVLSDDTREPFDPGQLSITDEGVVYARVKGGAFEARFTQGALAELASHMREVGGSVELMHRGVRHAIARRVAR